MSRPAPLLLVGHGTSDERGVSEFVALIRRLSRRLAPGGIDVDGGFIEQSPPTVNGAFSALAGRGHEHIAAVPLVLVAAGHAKGDIPAALEREARRSAGTTYRMGRPLGPHPMLLALLTERIDAVLPPRDRADTAVLLVGRGSTDPDANAEVCKVARLLHEGRGFAFVETAFVSLTWPDVSTGLARCAALGAERVVVAPYFLFDGVLPRRVVEQAGSFGRTAPELDVRVAAHIGDCDALAGLVLERYHEVLHGDIRMNCDTCAYRVLLPGFEDKLASPQTPHDHPDDPVSGHVHTAPYLGDHYERTSDRGGRGWLSTRDDHAGEGTDP